MEQEKTRAYWFEQVPEWIKVIDRPENIQLALYLLTDFC
jgi:hypothetical protein